MRDDLRRRLTDSLETATQLADGLVRIEEVPRDPRPRRAPGSTPSASPARSTARRWPSCAPRTFSFNSPHGACPQCTGLGFTLEIDPELIVDPERTLAEGAILPWTDRTTDYYDLLMRAIAEEHGIDLDRPWRRLPERHRTMLLEGPRRRERLYLGRRRKGRQLGLVRGRHPAARRQHATADVQRGARQRRAVHVAAPVPGVRRRAPQARGPRRHGGRPQRLRALPDVGGGRARVLRRHRPQRHPGPDRRRGSSRRCARGCGSSTTWASGT